MSETTKELFGTSYKETCGKISVLDAATGTYKQVKEKNVMGRFAKIQILNGFKSRQAGKEVFDEVVVCQIKIKDSVSKDVVSHKVVGAKGAELKERFATAWAEYEKLAAPKKADKEEKESKK